MINIKLLSDGIFYPNDEKELRRILKGYEKTNSPEKSELIIVPHAGYEFSGELAFQTYSHLKKDTQNIIVIAPAIYNKIYGIVTSNAEKFLTPLGEIQIKPADCEIDNSIFETESALTVQLPMIKYIFPNATVTPLIYGCEDYSNICKIIKENIGKSSIVIASNLSRFIPERESIKLDNQTSRYIERNQIDDFDIELADGAIGICGAIKYAKSVKKNFVKTGLTNSSRANGDTSSVVGYGGWYLPITQ